MNGYANLSHKSNKIELLPIIYNRQTQRMLIDKNLLAKVTSVWLHKELSNPTYFKKKETKRKKK